MRMKISHILEEQILQILDQLYSRWPQAVPDSERLRHCKIVSHRGDYDNQSIFENTLAAFDRVKAQGVWGIEFDLRWTADLHPVVIHDADLRRVFGSPLKIRQTTLAELKARCPLVPTLAEMVQGVGKKTHLMIEIKAEYYPDPAAQNRILQELLSPLEPEADYHLLTLTPEMYNLIECVPRSAFLPVAQLNYRRVSKMAITQNYSGFAGHYLLLTRARLQMHKAFKQKLATGYVNSKNCLFRELNRGVEWIFSDNAVALQKVVHQLLQGK